MNHPLMRLDSVAYSLPQGRELFSNLNFVLEPGEVLHIHGPNGAGKSTLLRICLNQIRSARGRVTCLVPKKECSYVPQMQNLEFHLPVTLEDVIGFSLPKGAQSQVLNLGLLSEAQLKLLWNTASGGERQRTLLTCALLQSPRLLFLDEPLNHLDSETRSALVGALGRYLKEKDGRGLVLVSHLSVQEIVQFGVKIKSICLGEDFEE